MSLLHETKNFAHWFDHLSDQPGKAQIINRLRMARVGNFGDSKGLGDGVSEMRIHSGPGYRVYYARKGHEVYLLLLGGDKASQKRDIRRAKELWKEMQEDAYES